jgi:hypothetical protein
MRAGVLKVYNAPEVTEFQAPEARNGLRVVEMLMAGLNPADIVISWRISREPGSDRKSRRTERSLSISSVSKKRITS